ncbi:hypothetical protein [Hydrogenophaga sp.]|uniref:hypothetical protein n=1 Tax=Hydrogenophaga sp. TaxID=1904254 RepID=UPI003F6E4A14
MSKPPIDVMDAAWREACESGMSGYIVMDGTAQRVISRLEMEIDALDRVCSPAGLKSLFPGLGARQGRVRAFRARTRGMKA